MRNRLNKLLLLTTVISMDLLTGMEFDLFVPSFPQLQSEFNLSPFWVETLLSVNFIGYCLSIFFVGKMADQYGRKPIILAGILTFIIGSAICIYPPSFYFLFIGRFLQGVGIASPAILSFLIIADSYPMKEQQFLLALLNGAMNLAVAISPIIGSYITLYFGWHGNFEAMLILGIATLVMTMSFIPVQKTSIEAPEEDCGGYKTIAKSKPLMLLIVNIVFCIVPYWVFVGISPLLFIKDLHVSLEHFGYYQGFFAFVFAIGCIFYGFILRHKTFCQIRTLSLSLLISVLSLATIGIVTITDSHSPILITLAFLVFVISQIIPSVILFPLALNFIPHAKARASALIQGTRLILSAVGVQIAGYFYVGTFQNLGITVLGFIAVATITLYYVINNEKLMAAAKS